MLSTIPSTFMLIAAQDFSQMTKEYSEHKKFELGHHRTAYDQFVHQVRFVCLDYLTVFTCIFGSNYF